MPITYFFATRADLIPGLGALQKMRSLQFIRDEEYSDSPQLPTSGSLSDATDLDHLLDHLQPRSWPAHDEIVRRYDLARFLVLASDVPALLEEYPVYEPGHGTGSICYRVRLPEEACSVLFTPGGLQSPFGVLWCGEIQAGYENIEELALYEQLVETLLNGFMWIGQYAYGPEALALGKQGMLYAYETHEPYKPKPWSYEDLTREQPEVPLPDKPAEGRLSLQESWDWLESSGYEVPRTANGKPRTYRLRPTCDGDPDDGLSFFRTSIDNAQLDRLTMPRTYMGKSGVYKTLFNRSDLTKSRLAANSFALCDFTEADLSKAYLACYFLRCTFNGAILAGADLRWSEFEDCTFEAANMVGARLTVAQASALPLSEEQRAEVDWKSRPGPEPDEF